MVSINSFSFPEKQFIINTELLKPLINNTWFELFLSKILAKLSPDNINLTLNFYKDGLRFNEDSATLLSEHLAKNNSLKDLPASFRITNAQLCSIEILKIIKILENKFQKSFTCNLYFTPGANRNCFDYYSDHRNFELNKRFFQF